MSRRVQRVDELLRREIADVLLRGELRDPRLRDTLGLSITAVRVSADLSHARVYFDVSQDLDAECTHKALQASAPAFRAKLGGRVQLRRIPELRFEPDTSVEQGLRIERILGDLERERKSGEAGDDDGTEGGDGSPDGSE